jgi:hypothetical protein
MEGARCEINLELLKGIDDILIDFIKTFKNLQDHKDIEQPLKIKQNLGDKAGEDKIKKP